ncbi:MAG: hypothetical protein NTY68_04420 [Candidatus Micrarchaeota archaeon]|nr:hypothetical protein [Candidatus Micrarchaeota archaeon]
MNELISKNAGKGQKIARIGLPANRERGLIVFKGAVESRNTQEQHIHSGAISKIKIPNIMGILSQFNGRIDRLNEEISKIISEIGKKGKKKERYEAEADRISEHYRACLSKISVLEVKIAVKIGKIDALNDRIKETDSSIEGVNEIGRILKEKMGGKNEMVQAAISAFEKGISEQNLVSMAEEIGKLKKEAKAESSEKDKLTEDLDFEKSRARQFAIEIDNALVARDGVSSEIAKLNSRIEKIEAEKKAEAEKIDFIAKKSGIDALERMMKKLNHDNDALRASVAELQKQRDEGMHAKDQFESLRNVARNIALNGKKMKEENARLAGMNHDLGMEIESMKARIQNAASLENQNAELAVTINRVRDELSIVKTTCEHLDNELIEKRDMIAALESQMAGAVKIQDVQGLHVDIEGIMERMEILERENDALKEKNRELVKAINEKIGLIQTLEDRLKPQANGPKLDYSAFSLKLETIETANRQLRKDRSELEVTVARLKEQLGAQAGAAQPGNQAYLIRLNELEAANAQIIKENSELKATADKLKDQLRSANGRNDEFANALTKKIQVISTLEDKLRAKAATATEAPSDPISRLRAESLEEMSDKYAKLRRRSESNQKALNGFLDEIESAIGDRGFFTKGRVRDILAKFHDQYHDTRYEKDGGETATKPDGDSQGEETTTF